MTLVYHSSHKAAAIVRFLGKRTLEQCIQHLIDLGELHQNAENWDRKQKFSQQYDFVEAYIKLCYGKEQFERYLNQACSK